METAETYRQLASDCRIFSSRVLNIRQRTRLWTAVEAWTAVGEAVSARALREASWGWDAASIAGLTATTEAMVVEKLKAEALATPAATR